MRFLFVSFLLFFASNIHAQEQEHNESTEDAQPSIPLRTYNDVRDVSELLNDTKLPHPHIITTSKIIYERNDTKVRPSDTLSVLIGFENTQSFTFVITDICAALTTAGEEPQYLRNYSALRPNITVNSKEIHTLEYRFQMDDKINPNEYGFVVAVFYHIRNGTEYTSIPLNGTISIVESPTGINARTFLVILAFIILVVVVAVYRRESIVQWCQMALTRIRARDFKGIFRTTKVTVKPKYNPNTGDPEKDQQIIAQREAEDEWMIGGVNDKYVRAERRRQQSRSPNRSPSSRAKPRGRSP